MAERIELPPTLQGDENAQLQQLWSYLYQMSEALNNNLQAIGGNELTDAERLVMNKILGDVRAAGETAINTGEMETLKSLIIKTADFVQTNLQEYRMHLLGESVASGQFGRYVRHTGLDVAVTPEGITQNYSFEEVVQGLKEYSINAKNYIKTGLLRTVGGFPVYGVAIGKDVVTFSEDGTETYNDGNKVAELTAEELSFWQNGGKVASYTGSKISFYSGNDEVLYIQNGKLYAVGDFEIGSGSTLTVESGGDIEIKTGGQFSVQGGQFSIDANGDATFGGSLEAVSGTFTNLKTTNWEFNNQGAVYDNNASQAANRFKMGLGMKTNLTNVNNGGVFFEKVNNLGWLYLVARDNEKNYTGQVILSCDSDTSGSFWPSSSNVHSLSLGSESHPWFKSYFVEVYGASSALKFYPTNGATGFMQMTDALGDLILDAYPASGGTSQIGQNANRWSKGYFERIISTNQVTVDSSANYKHDIKDIGDNGDKIDRLRPVSYIHYNDKENRRQLGLIWEETIKLFPEICVEDGDYRGIMYTGLVPILIKEIQELRARVKALEERG